MAVALHGFIIIYRLSGIWNTGSSRIDGWPSTHGKSDMCAVPCVHLQNIGPRFGDCIVHISKKKKMSGVPWDWEALLSSVWVAKRNSGNILKNFLDMETCSFTKTSLQCPWFSPLVMDWWELCHRLPPARRLGSSAALHATIQGWSRAGLWTSHRRRAGASVHGLPTPWCVRGVQSSIFLAGACPQQHTFAKRCALG